MPVPAFDLNIEEVLENWEVEHSLREIIANALDEQVLSDTDDISFYKDDQGDWHIRDFGRGLQIEHFTLKENSEKLNAPSEVIGKFGFGLKDALATLHRRGVEPLIKSSFGTFRLRHKPKHGFKEIPTLHVEFDESPNNLNGTEFVLKGVSDPDMEKAKSFFMKFADEHVLETTKYGNILLRKGNHGRVYIRGVLASEEPNFLFSYNITKLDKLMNKELNRERRNVGRSAYTGRVRAILKSTKCEHVQSILVGEVDRRAAGDEREELRWIEIALRALTLKHQSGQFVFLTQQELQSRPEIRDNATRDQFQVVVITEQEKAKLQEQAASGGPEVRLLETYIKEYNASFQYKFVCRRNLNARGAPGLRSDAEDSGVGRVDRCHCASRTYFRNDEAYIGRNTGCMGQFASNSCNCHQAQPTSILGRLRGNTTSRSSTRNHGDGGRNAGI